MKDSRRARRMQRHHRRSQRKYGFNLVSLMDIFTILVFFLLVNSSDVQTLPNPKELTLPDSTAEEQPRESTVVVVSREGIRFQDRPVISLEQALAEDAETVPELAAVLANQGPKVATESVTGAQAPAGRGEITIMADEGLPFRLLKRIMLTCTQADFSKISLAVLQQDQVGGL